MVRYHSPKEEQDAAKSADTPPDELGRLAQSSFWFVVVAVAENPNTEPNTLLSITPDDITTWEEQYRAVILLKNPKSPLDALIKIASKLHPLLDNGRGHQLAFEAGVILCCDPRIPFEVLSELLNADRVAVQFRKVVARETRRKDVLEYLLQDRSEIVKRKAHESFNSVISPKT